MSFSFCYFEEIIKSNIYIAKKIYLALSNKFSHVIYSFRELTKEILELEEFSFKPVIFKKHRIKKPSKISYL